MCNKIHRFVECRCWDGVAVCMILFVLLPVKEECSSLKDQEFKWLLTDLHPPCWLPIEANFSLCDRCIDFRIFWGPVAACSPLAKAPSPSWARRPQGDSPEARSLLGSWSLVHSLKGLFAPMLAASSGFVLSYHVTAVWNPIEIYATFYLGMMRKFWIRAVEEEKRAHKKWFAIDWNADVEGTSSRLTLTKSIMELQVKLKCINVMLDMFGII